VNKIVIFGIVFTLALLGVVFGIVGGKDVDMSGDMVNFYSAVAAVLIVSITVFVVIKYVNQMQNDTASGELAEHNWDGIGEYKNELPTGWAIMFIILIGWYIYYGLVKYPFNAYSQIGEYNEEVAEYNKKFADTFANIKNDPAKFLAMGKSVFNVNCAPCHGNTGDGLATAGEETLKAANLTHRLDAITVKNVIENGSNQLGYEAMGGMPAGMAAGDDVHTLAVYIAGGMSGEKPAAYAACASCHGEDGMGMEGVAPSIKTFDANMVAYVLSHGKKGAIGKMPSFAGILNDTQLEAAAAYVQSLSGAK